MVDKGNLYDRARKFNYTRDFPDEELAPAAESGLQHVGFFVNRIAARAASKYRTRLADAAAGGESL